MRLFGKLFGKKTENSTQEKIVASPDRAIVQLKEGRDGPFLVDPTAITHAFILTPNTCMPDVEQNNKLIIDKVLNAVNPELWPSVLQANENIPTLWLINNKSDLDDGLGLIIKAIDEDEAYDQKSIYIGTPTISLDGGQTQVSVYAGFAFTNTTPKIIVSAVQCKAINPE